MKEKTKQILRYVACGLGGLALGIGLLGGLSMCATSTNKTNDDVNTILTTERVKHNAKSTTENGGYDKYTFSVQSWLNGQHLNTYGYRVFDVDIPTYTLSFNHSSTNNEMNDSYYTISSVINSVYNEEKPNSVDSLKFLVIEGYTNISGSSNWYWYYFTFMGYHNPYMLQMPFYLLSDIFTGRLSLTSWSTPADYTQSPIIINSDKSDSFLISGDTAPASGYTFRFQDMVSYLKEAGYNDGYSEGHTAGYSEGYEDGDQEGYDNGYQDGNEHGQAQGYEDGYDDGYASGYTDGADNSLLFTKIGANQTAWSLSDISWDVQGDTYAVMKCLDFKDGDNNTYYVELNDYTSGGGEVQIDVYKNGTSSNNFYATIGRGDYNRAYTEIDIIPSSYLEFDFAQVITYYHNAIPNNWFMLSGTPANANGYQQGYQAGYRDGQMSTPSGQATDNVFSLFTSAFDSIGGIFEMKIFGFLPLYWFFLTPIFIAIITLLLRMVKH